MARIVSVNESKVFIDFDDGTLRDFALKNFDFTPQVGDEVNIVELADGVIISKSELQQSTELQENLSPRTSKKAKITIISLISALAIVLITIGTFVYASVQSQRKEAAQMVALKSASLSNEKVSISESKSASESASKALASASESEKESLDKIPAYFPLTKQIYAIKTKKG